MALMPSVDILIRKERIPGATLATNNLLFLEKFWTNLFSFQFRLDCSLLNTISSVYCHCD